MKILRDEDFIRGQVPMTKYIQRILTVGLLEVQPGDRFLDIGLGTGSIGIQAGLMGAQVIGIDKNPEAIDLTLANAEKHQVHLEAILGQAPDDLGALTIDKCFIGGGGSQMGPIVDFLDSSLRPGGLVLASFIITDNSVEFKNLLKDHGYVDIQTRLVQVAEENKYKMMMGQNPIYMIRGTKND